MAATPMVLVSPEELELLIERGVRRVLDEQKKPVEEPAGNFVSGRAIAQRYGVSRATVHNWATHEGCPHITRGKLRRFNLEAVEAWFRGRTPGIRRVK
jgi:hypothetical protein